MQKDSMKNFAGFGMNTDDSPEYIAKNDALSVYNARGSGTSTGEAGYIANVESTEIVPEPTNVPTGIKKVIGGRSFDDIKKAIAFRYNSFGYHQILVYDYAANDFRAVYTDLTDSNNIPLMPLDPQFYVTAVLLVNESYLVWTDGQSSIGFTNLDKLTSGAYGTILAEDFSLIKPQPLPPIVGYYSDDAGKASNFIKNKLFQFNAMWFGQDYTSSAWSTWSKRIIPAQESTPIVGDNVSKNNCIVLSVPVGSIRVQTINVGARYGNFGYNIIKSVERSYAVALTNTTIDIATEVLEAYDPATGLYSFVFYNDSVAIPVAPTDTDLAYDYVPLTAGAAEILNGNIIALGDILEGYERPVVDATISAVGYDPNLTVPDDGPVDEVFVITEFFPGESGSGAGNHRRRMYVGFRGVPHTGDVLTVVLADIRDATATQTYSYTVPAGQNGNLSAVVTTFSGLIPGSSLTFNTDGSIYIFFTGDPYYGGQRAYIVLMPGGSTLSKSIHSVLDNSSYQLAISHRDKYGRYFPLVTNNNYITKTPSFAQTQGLALKIHWLLNSATAPTDAVDYQWLITKNNTTAKVLDVLSNVISYKGDWNAHTNIPTLAANSGTVGDAYEITAPNLPTDTPVNLGNGAEQFDAGDYVVYNGKSWDIVRKEFGDLSSTSNIWVFKINPLDLFNTTFANNGQGTVLNYDFAQNDKCTLHFYYDSPTTKVWLNNPCIELGVVGYDPSTFLVKVTKSSSLDIADIAGKDVYLRLSSPKQQTASDVVGSEQTVWYEIGERFTITDGQYDTLSGDITDGDVYFKTRQYQGAVDPSVAYPYLATDFNFSDFYESAYTSYGRPRTFSDVLERTERKAIIRYSQNFVLGSRNNGLTRFFAETIYGESDGQTSSSWGAIGVLWQRGNSLVVIQETNTGYAPINRSILEDMAQQKQYAISEKLINDISYNVSGNIGIGRAKESFCFDDNLGWFIDPNKSSPIQIGLNGLVDISQKMNKYFKEVIQEAYINGKKLVMYYDRYYKEVIFATETDGGTLTQFSFGALTWNVLTGNVILPAAITPANGAHSTVAYNTSTGIATYTPSAGYVGNDVSVISFTVDGIPTTKNVCLNWSAGDSTPNIFYFTPLINQNLSTLLTSNIIGVEGINIATAISITGGQYSINGGSWVSSAGTVVNGDTVQVRQTSSGTSLTETDTMLTIGGISATFAITTGDATPSAFSFTPLTGQPLGTVETSNSITVSGITIPAPISVTGGSYSINGGSFVTAAGTVVSGDTVRVRQTSSGSELTTTNTVLTIGGVGGTFAVTTGTSVVAPFAFTDVIAQPLSTDITSNSITVSGNTIPSPISVSGGSYSKNGGSFVTSLGTVNAGDTVRVRVTSSASPNTATNVTLTIDGQSDTFTATTKQQVRIDWSMMQTAFTDCNLQVKANSVILLTSYTNDSGTTYCLEGDSVTAETFGVTASLAPNPEIHQIVQENGSTMPGGSTTIASSPPPDTSIVFGWTAVLGSVYNIQSYSSNDTAYGNVEINASYRRNNCSPGQSGTAEPIFIAANTYTSTISQADADAQATAAAQTQANTDGTCLVDSTLSTLLVDYNTDAISDLCAYVSTPALSETNLLVTGTAETPSGPLQQPDDGTPYASCFALSSDKLGSSSPGWRFGFNLAYFIAKYNGTLTTIEFTIRGRSTTSKACGGSYAARDISEGVLTLGGTTGSRIPSVTSGSSSPVGYSSHIVSGADGTVGLAVGSPILKLTFDFGTNLLTATTY